MNVRRSAAFGAVVILLLALPSFDPAAAGSPLAAAPGGASTAQRAPVVSVLSAPTPAASNPQADAVSPQTAIQAKPSDERSPFSRVPWGPVVLAIAFFVVVRRLARLT